MLLRGVKRVALGLADRSMNTPAGSDNRAMEMGFSNPSGKKRPHQNRYFNPTLRHQYASFLVNSGRTLYEVQQILGHADSSVTQRYAHLTSETLQAAANSASVAIQAATTTTIEIGI